MNDCRLRTAQAVILLSLMSWMTVPPVRSAEDVVERHYRLTADAVAGESMKATPEPVRPTGTGSAEDPYEYDLHRHTLDMETFRIRTGNAGSHTRIRVRSLLFNPFGDGGAVDFSMADRDVPDETDASGLMIDAAGSLWLRSIDTGPSHRGAGGPVALKANDVVWILGDVVTGHGPGSGGSGGDVDIRSENGPVVIEGHIMAWYRSGGDVTISGSSVDLQGGVESRSYGDSTEAGRIELTATNGSLQVKGMLRTDPDSTNARSADIVLSAMSGDLIVDGDINTSVQSEREGYRGGDVKMTAVGGDIRVNGRIHSSQHARPDILEERGHLELSAEDGAILLTELDVKRHGRITLKADAYQGTTIQGALLGLEESVQRGEIDRFESVRGHIYYDDSLSENTYLKGAAHQIKQPDGGSFYVMPMPVPPGGWTGEKE